MPMTAVHRCADLVRHGREELGLGARCGVGLLLGAAELCSVSTRAVMSVAMTMKFSTWRSSLMDGLEVQGTWKRRSSVGLGSPRWRYARRRPTAPRGVDDGGHCPGWRDTRGAGANNGGEGPAGEAGITSLAHSIRPR